MSIHVYLGGVEVDLERVLLPVDKGLTENADGTAATGGIAFDDPAGDLDLTGWTTFHVEEDDCDDPRIFTGWVISRGISRGTYKSGVSRLWNCDVIDINEYLYLTVLQGNRDDAMRPSETGTERIDWLMGTLGMAGIVFDNGQVTANAWEYDESDYRGQYAQDVLGDIVSASGVGRWTYFLYWDPTAAPGEEVSLFYNDVGDATFTSDIRISNVIADTDSDTLYPLIDAELKRDPHDQYGGVYVTAVSGRYYFTNPTTVAAMGLENPRDGTYTSERLINAATATRHGQTYLNWHSLEIDTITCTIQLPKERVNHLRAGHRLQVRFSHLPGYETFVWTRVASRTVSLLQADRSLYDVHLELSLKGVLQSGGGDPGDFPLPPSVGQEHWYEGDLTVCAPVHVTTYGEFATSIVFPGDTTFTYNWEITGNTAPGGTGVFTAAHDVTSDNIFGSAYTTPGPVWTPAGTIVISGTFTTGAFDQEGRFALGVLHNDITEGCTSVHFWVDPDFWVPIPPSDEPPEPGQEVPWQTPLEAPDGVRTTFTTRYPFAAGALHVRVDDLDQDAAIIATNGSAAPSSGGTIGGNPATRGVLSFTPEPPDATAASNSLAAVHAARDAAGVGGVLRLPSGLGTYPAGMVALNGQTWNFDPAASWPTVDVDTNGVNGVTIRGGTCTGGMFLSRGTTGGHQTTLENFHLATGQMVTVESKNNFVFRNFDYDMNNSNPVVALWANNAADADMNDPLIENFTGTRSGGTNTSMITARGYEGGAFTPHFINRLRILNFDTYNGTGTGAGTQTGWFGFELKSCPDAEVANGEAAGGEVLISTPDSDRPYVHHNILHLRAGTGTATFGATYWAAEFPNSDGGRFLYNQVVNDGDAAGGLEAVNANSSSNGVTVQYNTVTLANSLFGKSAVSPGGDHTVTDNRLTSVANQFTGNDSAGHPSTFLRNGPTDGPGAGGGPTFTLSYAPRVNEIVTYRIQGR